MAESPLDTEPGRRRILAAVLTLTEDTRLAPSVYERELLDRFVWGELTLDQVEARLAFTLALTLSAVDQSTGKSAGDSEGEMRRLFE